jgi:predicted GNAT family N-acyltransferase
MSQFKIINVAWESPQAALLRVVREQVFIREQQYPAETEWESCEMQAIHLLALDTENKPIGNIRLLPDGEIGRVAVMLGWRKQGVGSALMTKVLAIAQARVYPKIFLHAQTHAIPFYQKFGFSVYGEIFEDAKIPHQKMFLSTVTL